MGNNESTKIVVGLSQLLLVIANRKQMGAGQEKVEGGRDMGYQSVRTHEVIEIGGCKISGRTA